MELETVCNCNSCTYYRRVEQVKESNDPVILKDLIAELYERYSNTAFDLNYYEAIHEGTWPSARKQAIGIIERAEVYEIEQTQLQAKQDKERKQKREKESEIDAR